MRIDNLSRLPYKPEAAKGIATFPNNASKNIPNKAPSLRSSESLHFNNFTTFKDARAAEKISLSTRAIAAYTTTAEQQQREDTARMLGIDVYA